MHSSYAQSTTPEMFLAKTLPDILDICVLIANGFHCPMDCCGFHEKSLKGWTS